jgi:mercuric ion transport protein
MKPRTMVKTGVAGALAAALFCLTPVLVIGLGAVGLSAATGWLDYVLVPVFVLCAMLAGYGWWRRRRRP